MTIEACGAGKFLIMLSREDLISYDVSFAAMKLSEPHTRQMISDLIRRVGGGPAGQAQVECAQMCDRGCAILITLRGAKRYIFRSTDDVISAANAGLENLLKEGLVKASNDYKDESYFDGNYFFTPSRKLSPDETMMLLEFAELMQNS